MNIEEIITENFKTTKEAIPSSISPELYATLIKFMEAAEIDLKKKISKKCHEISYEMNEFLEDHSMELGKENYNNFQKLEDKINKIMF